MRKILTFLMVIFCAQVFAQSYTGDRFTARTSMKSPLFLKGSVDTLVSRSDTANAFKAGSFSKYMYRVLKDGFSDWNEAYGWGDHQGLYKPIGDSISLSGYFTNYKASFKQDTLFANTGLFKDGDTIKYDGIVIGDAWNGYSQANGVDGISAGFGAECLNPSGYPQAYIYAQGMSCAMELGIYVDTTGVHLESTNPVDGSVWTDDYIITKGYADSTYTQGAFAQIGVTGNVSAQNIPNGSTATKITAFSTDGPELSCNADAANDRIVITNSGTYRISVTMSLYADTEGVMWSGGIYYNGSTTAAIFETNIISTSSIETISFSGLLSVTDLNHDLDFRVYHDQAGYKNLTIKHILLHAEYIGRYVP